MPLIEPLTGKRATSADDATPFEHRSHVRPAAALGADRGDSVPGYAASRLIADASCTSQSNDLKGGKPLIGSSAAPSVSSLTLA